MKMPVLFAGHGNPMYTLTDNEFKKEWDRLATSLPKPKAVLCISAHWETNGTRVTSSQNPETIHDFGGFPEELYAVEYPAPGSPELADRIKKLITKTEIKSDDNWGLDHGCWCIMKHLFPNADVPVVELSIDYNKSLKQHYELAKELAELREEGVMITGSGNIVHNLRMVDWRNENAAHQWAISFNNAIKDIINRNDIKSLLAIETKEKDYHNAAPTPEHFIPLLYAMALKTETDKVTFFNDKIVMGSLSMTSIKLES